MAMRILFLTREAFPTFRADVTTLFGECLPEQGIGCDLVALRTAEQTTSWAAGTAYTRLAKSTLGRVGARLLLSIDFFRLSGKNDYAALQVRDSIVAAIFGLMTARRRGLPFFYWMSLPFAEVWQDLGTGKEASSLHTLKKARWRVQGAVAAFFLYRVVLKRSDHVFVQSDAMRTMLHAKGVPLAKMTPVPMGVILPQDLNAIAPVADAKLHGRTVAVYLGALERIRHPEIMLHAMAIVKRQLPNALLLLVGDSQLPGEREWLAAQVKHLGLEDHVHITGWVVPELAKRYLRSAKIGLSPIPRSRVLDVGSPTKVCEYLAYGLPVVANDQPDQAFLLRETGGGICVALTPEGFAQGMQELLADPLHAQRLADTGRLRLNDLRSYHVIAAKLAQQYRSLLAAGRST